MKEKRESANMFRNFSQRTVVLLLKMLSRLPFWILYLKSDFLYFLMEYIFRYRRKVIDENLWNAFPEKNESERSLIRKKFYRHFCDFIVETLKLYSISEAGLAKRISFDMDTLNKISEASGGSIILAMHHNNWEWGSFMQKKTNIRILGVFNRMRENVPFDNFLEHARARWGGEGVVMSSAARTSLSYKSNKIPFLLWLAADQSSLSNSKFWISFMNREAPFFPGPVVLAQKLNHPIFFQHTQKIGRGKYRVGFVPLVERPNEVSSDEILNAYVNLMEEVIRKEPEYYLWSHKRWKHTRPENVPLIEKRGNR